MTVLETLRQAFARAREKQPGFTEDMSEDALQEILAALGGERVIIPKTTRGQGQNGRPAIPADVKEAAYRDALGSEPTETITSRHGISRASLYRLVKRGPR